MREYQIRRMIPEELEKIYERITQDFAEGEYAPYEVLLEQLHAGSQEGFVLGFPGEDLAYCICAAGNKNGYVLASLIAVLPQFRGQGIGTAFINALRPLYAHKKGVIGEVEIPELAQSAEDRIVRERRIALYEKLGFHLVPGIEYTIWDVPMNIMALPLTVNAEEINRNIIDIIKDLYRELMGEELMHKLEISRK